jgi:hypothetical protein
MDKERKFEIVHRESIGFLTDVAVLRDRQTGVLYLFTSAGYAGGLSPLLDAEGKPIVEKGSG